MSPVYRPEESLLKNGKLESRQGEHTRERQSAADTGTSSFLPRSPTYTEELLCLADPTIQASAELRHRPSSSSQRGLNNQPLTAVLPCGHLAPTGGQVPDAARLVLTAARRAAARAVYFPSRVFDDVSADDSMEGCSPYTASVSAIAVSMQSTRSIFCALKSVRSYLASFGGLKARAASSAAKCLSYVIGGCVLLVRMKHIVINDMDYEIHYSSL